MTKLFRLPSHAHSTYQNKIDRHRLGSYSCIFRIVDRNPKLGEIAKAQFIKFMREYAAFCGVRILTFCIMSDQFPHSTASVWDEG